MNKQLANRLLALEKVSIPQLGTRLFTTYEHSGLYDECGIVDYRRGLNGLAAPGVPYTIADIDALKREGWTVDIITISYGDWPPGA